MNYEEKKKRAEEIRKMLKVKKQIKRNTTDLIIEEVYKRHKNPNKSKEDNEVR